MKYLNIFLCIVALTLLAIFAYKLLENTKPHEVKDCVVAINVTAEQKAANGRSVRITQKALEDALRQSAYAARQEAQNEYDKNFSILLTILTIFGIAWPLVVAFIQHKLNEKEIDKIEYATKKIKDIEKQTKEINWAIATSYEAAETLFLQAYRNDHSAKSIANYIISFDFDLNYSVKSGNKSKIVAIISDFFRFLDSMDNNAKNDAKEKLKAKATPDRRFVSGKEIKEILGTENIELYRKYREFFITLYPWKFRGDEE